MYNHLYSTHLKTIKNMIENSNPLVSICCLTYNQVHYLRQCIESLIMQKTSFAFEILIHDDCSNDGTQDIIKEYASLYPIVVKPYIQSENQFSQGKGYVGIKINVNRARGKYLAFCEGDDYWIDPLKLQKQADFLDNHPEYSLIGSNGIVLHTSCEKGLNYFNNQNSLRDVSFNELVNTWAFPSASLFFRKEVFNYYPIWADELSFADDIIVMTCAIHGKVATLGELSCVYRKGCGITKEMDKKQEYMAEQHKLFYTHLLEDTGNKYKDILLHRICNDEREKKYWHLYNKSKLLTALIYPKRSIKKALTIIFDNTKHLIKCLKVI